MRNTTYAILLTVGVLAGLRAVDYLADGIDSYLDRKMIERSRPDPEYERMMRSIRDPLNHERNATRSSE